MKKTIIPMTAAVLLGLGAAASALEVSLEENKAERGNIGYVDLKKVFRLYPETGKAKQSYAEIIRQAEEQVNLRKAELMAMRAELSKLKVEKELVEKTPIPAAAPVAQPSLVVVSTPTVEVSTPAVQASTAAAPVHAPNASPDGAQDRAAPGPTGRPSAAGQDVLPAPAASAAQDGRGMLGQLPGMGALPAGAQDQAASAATVVASTATDAPLIIDIPGVTESPIVVDPGAVNASTPAVAAPAPVPSVDPREEAIRAREKRTRELDEAILSKQKEIDERGRLFEGYQAQVEKDLIDIESRRAEMLLGKIYDAVREVARESGVSVVVDKTQILFGQNSVDLTDKVLKKLKEASL